MAVAPVNRFLTVAVPVAPGTQKIYEVPTGTSAILLYAQVSNVAGVTTYPTTTLIHKENQEARETQEILESSRTLKFHQMMLRF